MSLRPPSPLSLFVLSSTLCAFLSSFTPIGPTGSGAEARSLKEKVRY